MGRVSEEDPPRAGEIVDNLDDLIVTAHKEFLHWRNEYLSEQERWMRGGDRTKYDIADKKMQESKHKLGILVMKVKNPLGKKK